MTPAELTIHHAQVHQPWVLEYARSGVLNGALGVAKHVFAINNILHAAKTVGKLAAVFEELDHTGKPITLMQAETVKDMAADLVSEALRLANLYGFDLATELVRRVEEKNSVNILNVGKS